jgi:hypothetical protein
MYLYYVYTFTLLERDKDMLYYRANHWCEVATTDVNVVANLECMIECGSILLSTFTPFTAFAIGPLM